jgi:hypothetical protein
MANKLTEGFNNYFDESQPTYYAGTNHSLDYLTVACSIRPKATAKKCLKLLESSEYAKAFKKGDGIGYQVAYNDWKSHKRKG